MKVKRTKVRYKRNAKTKNFVVTVLVVAALLGVGLLLSGVIGRLADGNTPPAASTPSAASQAASVSASVPDAPTSSVQSQPAAVQSVKAVSPDRAALTDLAALKAFCDTAKNSGATAVVVDVKDAEGHLLYRNVGAATSRAAVYAHLSTRDDADLTYTVYSDLQPLVSVIHDAGLQAVARINCFNDAYSGKSIPGSRCAVTGGTTWVDDSPANGGRSWLNPYAPSAQQFLLDVAADCRTFGFDAIIADYVQFPVGYSLNRIDYGEAALTVTKAQALSDFLSRLTAQTSLPVWLTVRTAAPQGAQEFAGHPYDYAPNTLAGFIAVLNAPANPRKNAAQPMDDAQLAAALAALPTDRRVIPCVITDTPSAVLTQQQDYVIMK